METEKARTWPVFKRKLSSLSVTVWDNGAQGNWSIRLQRSYRDPQGNWKTADSLRPGDVPSARLLLKAVEDWLLSRDEPNGQASEE